MYRVKAIGRYPDILLNVGIYSSHSHDVLGIPSLAACFVTQTRNR